MNKISILVVEDDDTLRVTLKENLVDEGYHVDVCANGGGVDEFIAVQEYELIILDIMLPDTDGYTICRKLRSDGIKSMVMMLTARSLEDDLVKGFEAGADDYLSKPYRLRELLMRVKALVRRNDSAPISVFRFGPFTLDYEARTVMDGNGKNLELTKTEFDLLVLFVKRNGQALTRDQILDEVWGDDIVVDHRTVDNFVSSLKRKLDWNVGSKFSISTIRGVGYRFVA